MKGKVVTEKLHNKMGKTRYFKLKDNEKTIMMLDKKVLSEKMANIRLEKKAGKTPGVLSKIINTLRKSQD